MTDIAESLARYGRFFETLAPESLAGIAAHVTTDIRFQDPFNELHGVDDLIRMLTKMFEHGTPRFVILDRAVGEDGGYLLWRYTNDPGSGKPSLVITGMSAVKFAPDGRIREHVDHWDSGSQFYERIPILRWLIGIVKRRIALPPPPVRSSPRIR